MSKRLFTFGCSFTNYFYPTWADFIGSSFDVYENWGRSGAGNFFIATQIFESNQLNNFTKDDTILVMFTNYTRNDYINENSEFVTCGNIYSNTCYDENYLKKYWSAEHGFYTTWFSINSAYNLLKNIGCKFKFMLAFDLRLFDQYAKNDDIIYHGIPDNKPIMIHCYNSLIELFPTTNLNDFRSNDKAYNFIEGNDFHPTIKNHYDWIKTNMDEYYNEKMDIQLEEWEKLLAESKKKTISNFSSILKNDIRRFRNTKTKIKNNLNSLI